MTRREVNRAFTAGVAALFSGGVSAVLKAKAPPVGQNKRPGSNASSIAEKTLIQEPLAEMPDPEVSVITLTLAPGSSSSPHEHTGPVFAYILEGKIENQVDPEPPRTYEPGEYFYEPAMHVHRVFRNLSNTQPAKLLIFQVGEKGKEFTLSAK